MPHARNRIGSSPHFRGVGPFRPAALGVVALLAALGPPPAAATSLMVPDQAPSIQAALDALVDTVLVRPGTYAESPITRRSGWLMAAPGGPSDMPAVAGLTIQDAGDLVDVRGLRVDGQVLIRSSCCPVIRFTGCDLRGGVADVSYEVKTISVLFDRCSLSGSLALAVRQLVRLDSCQVTGTLRASPSPGDGSYLVVLGCTFQGDGTGTAIAGGAGEGQCTIVGNTIRGFVNGIGVGGYSYIADNLIEDCSWHGIAAGEFSTTIENNVVRRCGTISHPNYPGACGIAAGAERGGVTLRGNTVVEGENNGIEVRGAASAEVVGNVVWGRGGDGFRINRYYELEWLKVTRNTSCANGGAGFVWDDPIVDRTVQGLEWTRNIGHANDGYGLIWLSSNGGTVACNDWFANQAGDVSGQPPGAADFSVDPLFCDPDLGDFQLNSASPLSDWPGCGQIGALGVGCGVTPTLVQRFTATRINGGVRVVWQVAEGATASEVWVERAEGVNGQAWTEPVMERSSDGRAVVELDRSAALDRAYRYRLVARDGGHVAVLDPGIVVEAQARHSFGLVEVGPSPGSGPVRIAFTLPHAAAVQIDVFDLLGRRVTSLAEGVWSAGAHSVEWNALTHDGKPAPGGLYLLRYAYPGGQDSRRIVISR